MTNDNNTIEPLEPKWVADEDIQNHPEDVIKGLIHAYVGQEERLKELEAKKSKDSSGDDVRDIINKAAGKAIKKTIREIDEECHDQYGAPISEVKGWMDSYGLGEELVEDTIERLVEKGELYYMDQNRVKVV